jgi:hypothetical protein
MPFGGATFDGMRKTLAGGGAGLVSTMPTVAETKKTTVTNSSRRATKGVRRLSMAAGSGDGKPPSRPHDQRQLHARHDDER